jgi:hypothetical protein
MSTYVSRKTLKAASLVVTLALMLPGLAAAKDYCITIASSSYILIGKGFVPPIRGNCRAWIGLVNQTGYNAPSTGTACASSDGTHLNFSITTTYPQANVFYFDSVSLALPSHVGTDYLASLGSNSGGTLLTAVGAACKTQTVPASDFNSATANPDRQIGPGVPK